MADGRFAPSPTGDLHLGNLRTAVLAWLWSRHLGGRFVVRMEDLDRMTSSVEHERSQLGDLAAIGLDWDGEVVRQSDRFDRYATALHTLEAAGATYPCYCTRREIAEAISAPNAPATSGYPGTCRDLTAAERRAHEGAGRPPALRLRSGGAPVEFVDAVLGVVSGASDDVVLRRNDGVPAYNLAVVVDDDEQGIDLVVRGDDLAPSALSQLRLYDALGLDRPSYAHVPLVLSPSGGRLAKRDGSVTLAARVALGDAPVDVARWALTTSGLTADAEAVSPNELLSAAAASFDPARLDRRAVVVSEDVLHESLRSPE